MICSRRASVNQAELVSKFGVRRGLDKNGEVGSVIFAAVNDMKLSV